MPGGIDEVWIVALLGGSFFVILLHLSRSSASVMVIRRLCFSDPRVLYITPSTVSSAARALMDSMCCEPASYAL